MNILFVCGRNKRRSPTAEAVFCKDPRISVRSGGTSESSRRRVTPADLRWADLLCVMERRYELRLRALNPRFMDWPPVRCLDIPDDFEMMDPELIEILQLEMTAILIEYGLE